MSSITNEKIRSINKAIRNNDDSLKVVLANYKSNIERINNNLNGISFDDWEDDVATRFSNYKDFLKTGVVSKLNSSIGTNGSMTRLNYLLTDLYNKCNAFTTNYNSIKSKDTSLVEEDGKFVSSSMEEEGHYTSSQIAQINERLDEDRGVIEDVLKELVSLRFDTIVDYDSIGSRDMNGYSDIEITKTTKKTTTLVQFDKVMIYVDGFDEQQEMYYLGTDSKGRSYFSYSLDDDAPVYRAELPDEVGGFSSFLNDTEKLAQPGFAEARVAAVLFGEDLDNPKVKDVLKKIGGSYANGLYTDDANFNTSITYHDMEYAPTIVEKGNGVYDAETAYHVMNVDPKTCISLSEIFDQTGSDILDEHPTIILKPGEKITTKYNIDMGFFEIPTLDFLKESRTIGSDEEYTILKWDEEKGLYYVLNEKGSYYTASNVDGNIGKGYRYIQIEQLRASSTVLDIK